MKTHHLHFSFCLLLATEFIAPVFLQSIQSRHYRPLPSKCDRYGRCAAKEGSVEEVDQVDDDKSDKDRPVEVSRDDWPVRTGVDYDKKEDVDKNEKSGGVRPVGGGGYGGGYKPKPVVDRDEDLKTSGGVRPGGGSEGYGGGYNPKPTGGRDEDSKTTGGGRPSGGSGGYGSNYNPKPVDRDEDLKTTGGGRPSGGSGGYGGNYKPVDRDEDLKTTGGGRPSGGSGGYGGNYKPVDRDEIKPSRPSGGGGYGGGYDPKPVVDRDEYDIKPGGGYVTKPGGNRGGGGYIPKPDDDYSIKPASGLDGYDEDRKPTKDDLGDKSKYDYNDYGIKDDGKGSDYDLDAKPIPVIEGNCICVPYYQCQEGHIVTDGAGIIDARKRPQPDDELPLDGKFKPPSCGPYHVCCNTPESSTVKPYEHRCGVRNPSGINSRILSPSNKGEADFGEWPWQAAVLKSEGKVNIFQCGGVLIDKYHVITVAHCVFPLYHFNEYPLKVRLGEWDTQTTTEFLAHEDYKVSKIIIHPEFRNDSLWNDIAILRLQDPVLFAPHIDTVCLPQYDEVFADQNCVVTGWGKDAYKGGTFSNVMKEVALQVIDNYKCEEMLRKTRLGRFFQLHEGFLCAGGEYGIDSCKGDGGGPLVCYRKDKSYALAGIVSWGIDCGQPEVPGVYVKIQKYLEWISKTTGVTLQDYWPRKL